MSEWKLYRVVCRGMQSSHNGIPHGDAYVVAKDPHEAYRALRDHLDKHDLGFFRDRELARVEEIAGTGAPFSCSAERALFLSVPFGVSQESEHE